MIDVSDQLKMALYLTLMLQLGCILPPRRTFYPVALKPLEIVRKAFVTFRENMWAKKMLKNFFQISPLGLVFPIWRLENGHPTKKA